MVTKKDKLVFVFSNGFFSSCYYLMHGLVLFMRELSETPRAYLNTFTVLILLLVYGFVLCFFVFSQIFFFEITNLPIDFFSVVSSIGFFIVSSYLFDSLLDPIIKKIYDIRNDFSVLKDMIDNEKVKRLIKKHKKECEK